MCLALDAKLDPGLFFLIFKIHDISQRDQYNCTFFADVVDIQKILLLFQNNFTSIKAYEGISLEEMSINKYLWHHRHWRRNFLTQFDLVLFLLFISLTGFSMNWFWSKYSKYNNLFFCLAFWRDHVTLKNNFHDLYFDDVKEPYKNGSRQNNHLLVRYNWYTRLYVNLFLTTVILLINVTYISFRIWNVS